MKPERIFVLLVVLIALTLTACAAPAAPTEAPASETPAPTPTEEPTAEPPTATPEPVVTIHYHGNAQVELISPEGTRVLIDVYSPRSLSTPATADDILLTTHSHGDHMKGTFMEAFEGQQLDRRTGEITAEGVYARSIASAHGTNLGMLEEGGSNYLFLVEMGGLRIAHFGDIGQAELTPEQLEILGEIDILITQLANPYADMSAENEKGFNLIAQLNPQPRVIITTHINEDTARLAWERWTPAFIEDEDTVTFSPSSLPEETTVYYIGLMAKTYRILSEQEQ